MKPSAGESGSSSPSAGLTTGLRMPEWFWTNTSAWLKLQFFFGLVATALSGVLLFFVTTVCFCNVDGELFPSDRRLEECQPFCVPKNGKCRFFTSDRDLPITTVILLNCIIVTALAVSGSQALQKQNSSTLGTVFYVNFPVALLAFLSAFVMWGAGSNVLVATGAQIGSFILGAILVMTALILVCTAISVKKTEIVLMRQQLRRETHGKPTAREEAEQDALEAEAEAEEAEESE